MSDRIAMLAKCPYYIEMTDRAKWHGIECDEPEINLGFSVRHYHRFDTHQDALDYTELFCRDMYWSCPYYKWVTTTIEEQIKKGRGR